MSNGNCEASVTVCNVTYDYDVGDQVRLNMTFTDQQTSLPTDPDTVALTITAPDLSVSNHAYDGGAGDISRSAEGVYHYELLFTQSGAYHYLWQSTGHGAGVFQSSLGVKPTGPVSCPSVTEQRSAAIANLALEPRRVRGDQGEVEAKSVDEVIKADQYAQKRQWNRNDLLQNSIVQNTRYKSCS